MAKSPSHPDVTLKDRLLYINGSVEAIELRPMEARLLALLLRHPNQVVSRVTIMREVWETDFMEDTRTLDVHICWLRRKIEVDPTHPQRLVTVKRVGYRLMVYDPEQPTEP